ncbi:7TM diverse intracellular signaling domain-containing protein [Pseudobacteriovorax antillogorgiicola]|nr:7TM diverse intracellular signaling domain-containing protein [Pseudobacteriovorax antillogorgiicola]
MDSTPCNAADLVRPSIVDSTSTIESKYLSVFIESYDGTTIFDDEELHRALRNKKSEPFQTFIDHLDAKYVDRLGIQDIVKKYKSQEFESLAHHSLNFGNTPNFHWYHFKAEVPKIITENLMLKLSGYYFDARVWIFDEDGKIVSQFRDSIAFPSSNSFTLKNGTVIAFPLELKSRSIYDFYIRVDTSYEPHTANFSFVKKLDLEAQLELNAYIDSGYAGIIVSLFLYNLFIYVFTRDSVYLYYCLYVASLAHLCLFLKGVYYPVQNVVESYQVHVFGSLAVTSLMGQLFAKKFLGVKRFISGKLITNFKVFYSIWIFNMLGSIFLPSKFMVYSSLVATIFALVTLTVMTALAIRNGYIEGYTFAVAFLALFIGSFAKVFESFAIIPKVISTWFSIQLGSALELILLSVSMGTKIRILADTLRSKNKQIMTFANHMEDLVNEKTAEIRVIHDSIPQGLFTVSDPVKLHVENGYSAKLESIVDQDKLESKSINDILLRKSTLDKDQINIIITCLSSSLGADDLNFELNSHNLPREIEIEVNDNQKVLEVDWIPVKKDESIHKILVSLRDVTDSRAMELTIKRQEIEAAICLELVDTDPELCEKFFTSTRFLVKKSLDFIDSGDLDATSLHREIFINVHTIKGNARSLNLRYLATQVHVFEDILEKNEEFGRHELLNKFSRVIDTIKKYESINNVTLNRLTRPSNQYSISNQTIEEILDILDEKKQFNESKKLQLLLELERMRSVSLADVLSDLKEMLISIAHELGKEIPSLRLTGNLYMDTNISIFFTNILTHLLRNSIDHGIEKRAIREDLSKPANGQIFIRVEERTDKESIVISISDDGKGLDLKKLEKMGIEKGLLPKNGNTSSQIADIVFSAGLSTANKISEISGRGVGLNSVKSYVESHDSCISIALKKPNNQGNWEFSIDIEAPRLLFADVVLHETTSSI